MSEYLIAEKYSTWIKTMYLFVAAEIIGEDEANSIFKR